MSVHSSTTLAVFIAAHLPAFHWSISYLPTTTTTTFPLSMRAHPPPRRSRLRQLRKLLHRLLNILKLQFLRRNRTQFVVKRRRTPFHFTSRKYKVKVPYGERPRRRRDRLLHPFRRRVVTTQIFNTDVNQMVNGAKEGNVQFKKPKRTSLLLGGKATKAPLKLLVQQMV